MRVHARRLTAGLLVAATLAVGAAGCSASGYAGDDAATNLERNLQLPDDRLQCMRDRFGDGKVANVMDPEHVPTDDERAAFVHALRECLPVEVFAQLLAGSIQVDSSGNGVGATQADCVKLSIESMTPEEQDHLYLHFANPAALDADAVRDTTALLVAACGLGGDDPSGTVLGPVATTPPGSAGATTTTGR